MTRGVVYVVWWDRGRSLGSPEYYRLAADKSRAARRLGLPTCLISDREPEAGAFDHFLPFDCSDIPGVYPKTLALTETPFDVTLYTDVDVLLRGILDPVFRGAERYGFAATFSPGQTFHHGDREYLHYNGGYWAFAGRRPDVAAAWREAGSRYDNPYSDEPALAVALDELSINPFVLPSVFNLTVKGWVHPREIRGWHSHLPPQSHLVSLMDNPLDRTEGGA